jgi:CubicO group peptidase (beta-lactamase class C family)
VGEVLGAYAGTALGSLSARELCTHTSGLPRLGDGVDQVPRRLPRALAGSDPHRAIPPGAVLARAARAPLSGRGRFGYSNLGTAVLGQMLAALGGAAFDRLLAERIFGPLGMVSTGVSRHGGTAPRGRTRRGLPRAPWVPGGYAPAGGVISTPADMTRLLGALLDGSAPGLGALEEIAGVSTPDPARGSGMFWGIGRAGHAARPAPYAFLSGQTGGYSSFLAVWPGARRGVLVLADVADAAAQERLGLALMT